MRKFQWKYAYIVSHTCLNWIVRLFDGVVTSIIYNDIEKRTQIGGEQNCLTAPEV